MLQSLPAETLFQIIDLLPVENYGNLACTSHEMKSVMHDYYLMPHVSGPECIRLEKWLKDVGPHPIKQTLQVTYRSDRVSVELDNPFAKLMRRARFRVTSEQAVTLLSSQGWSLEVQNVQQLTTGAAYTVAIWLRYNNKM